MIKIFVCLECGNLFEEPRRYVETHGLDAPPYEVWHGCPHCGEPYVEAHRCDECDEWITKEYVKIGDKRYCQDCYQTYDLGEEE